MPAVGLVGRVGLDTVGLTSGGVDVPFAGLQLARVAPAARVALNLMNVRREMEGRRVMAFSVSITHKRNNDNM
jgi:hypothetical protein